MTTYDDATARTRIDTDDRTIALVNYVLLLLGFFTSGITSLVAVILAYVRRGNAEPFARSHLGFQISTFWIGFGGTLIGVLLMLGAIIPMAMAGADSNGGDWSTVDQGGLAVTGVALLVVGGLVILAAQVASLVRCIYGLIKLSSDQPMRG